jgi:hypothetical protein
MKRRQKNNKTQMNNQKKHIQVRVKMKKMMRRNLRGMMKKRRGMNLIKI